MSCKPTYRSRSGKIIRTTDLDTIRKFIEAEVASVTEGVPAAMLSPEQYAELKNSLAFPQAPGLLFHEPAHQRSLINYIINDVVEAYEAEKAADPSVLVPSISAQHLFADFLDRAKELSQAPYNLPEYKYIVENWDVISKVVKYYLETEYHFKFKKVRKSQIGSKEEWVARQKETLEDTDEYKSLREAWQLEALSQDPAGGLSDTVRRFLGTIKNPDKPYLISPDERENFNPTQLYRKLLRLLVGTPPTFKAMLQVLESQKDQYPYLYNVIPALQQANEEVQRGFVSAMSKRYVNMKHLYLTVAYSQATDTLGGGSLIVRGIPREDNSNAKAQTTREIWVDNLYATALVKEVNETQRYAFDRNRARQLYEQFEKVTVDNYKDFDINKWLTAMGITLHPTTLATIKEKGTARTVTKKQDPYQAMFFADNGEFKNIAKELAKIVNSEGNVYVEAGDMVRESAIYRLAAVDARYNDAAGSHMHRSGQHNIFSYSENQYLVERIASLKSDVNLLNQLAVNSYTRDSWWLQQLLETKTENGKLVYVKDASNNVVLRPDANFAKFFTADDMALKAFIQKNLPSPMDQSLESLDPKQLEIVKLMFFQNNAAMSGDAGRRGRFFNMTHSNSNTMFTIETPVPTITFKEDGTLSDAVVDFMIEHTVRPEINRMLEYTDNHTINSYDKGYKLFYHYPQLNMHKELFNEDGSLRRDVETDPDLQALIQMVVRETLQNEIAYKKQEWQKLGIYTTGPDGKVSTINYFDTSYLVWLNSKIPHAADEFTNRDALVNYGAAEMVVGYMMHNVNFMQLVSTDPATQFKLVTLTKEEEAEILAQENGAELLKVAYVSDVMDNVGKRLKAEVSPGNNEALDDIDEVYSLGIIKDYKTASAAIDAYKKLYKDHPTWVRAYEDINATDAAELISLPEKLKFMRRHGKLSQAQINMLPRILEKYYKGVEAMVKGEDSSKYDLSFEELGVVFQPDKPIVTGTRNSNNVETKLYVKSAAFTLLPQIYRDTELGKLIPLMYNSKIDRLAFESAVKLGSSRKPKQIFDEFGNFIPGSTLDRGIDIFEIPRKFLKLQQEVPVKDETQISRVSQASMLAFVDILEKKGFILPNVFEKDTDTLKKHTGKDLYDKYMQHYTELYKASYEDLTKQLKLQDTAEGFSIDAVALHKLIQDELIRQKYPQHDLDLLAIEKTEDGSYRFKMPPWAAAKSGKLEAFLNSVVTNRILNQKFNGYSFVMGSEVGFKYTKAPAVEGVAKKQVFNTVEEAAAALAAEQEKAKSKSKDPLTLQAPVSKPTTSKQIEKQITYTGKFTGRLKSALENNGIHQVIIPWKLNHPETGEPLVMADYVDRETGKLDTSRMDPELLKMFSMRIPFQGPNSGAAVEIVGFLPPGAGDMIIAPKEFVAQMGADFDIDKLYSYMYNFTVEPDGKLVKIGNKASYELSAAQEKESVDNLRKLIEANVLKRDELDKKINTSNAPSNTDWEKFEKRDIDSPQGRQLEKALRQDYPLFFEARDLSDKIRQNKALYEELQKPSTRKESREYHQNQIMDIHLSIYTMDDDDIQRSITRPLIPESLREIAKRLDKIDKRVSADAKEISPESLSPFSGSFQTYKFQRSAIAQEAIGAFAVQNTFNAAVQHVKDLNLVRYYPPQGEPVYQWLTFGEEKFKGKGGLARTMTLRRDGYKSHNISSAISSAVDDEKEQILAKIGINSQTISIANFMMQAGFGLDTIAYFLKQDVIQEYTKQLSIHKNATKAYEIITKMDQFKLEGPEAEIFKNRGVNPNAVTAPKKYYKDLTEDELMENEAQYEKIFAEDPADRDKTMFWSFYNMGSDALLEILETGPGTREYLYTQHAMLEKFRDMSQYMVPPLRHIQTLNNVHSAGMGKNMWEALARQTAIENLQKNTSKVQNAFKLFGEYKLLSDTTPEEQKTLQEEGWVKGETVLLKPTSIPGLAAAYGVFTNNKLWQKAFPYSNSSVRYIQSAIEEAMDTRARDVFEAGDRNSKVFREVKHYLFTDNAVINEDIAETRKEFLFDYDTDEVDQDGKPLRHLSLASIHYQLKTNPETAAIVRNNIFLSSLFSRAVDDAGLPKSLLFRNPIEDEITGMEIYNTVYDMITNPKPLGVFNGIEYDTRIFVEHLALSTHISGTSALQQELLQYMPAKLYTESGIADRLRNYDWSNLLHLPADDATAVARMVTQYFQTFPQLAPEITLEGMDILAVKRKEYSEEEIKGGFDTFDNGEITEFSLKPTKGIPGKDKKFYYYKSGTERFLFRLVDAATRRYARLPVLFNSMNNAHEYNANAEIALSNDARRNPAELVLPLRPVFKGQSWSKTQQELSQERLQAQLGMLEKYGLSDTTTRDLSQEEIQQLLTAVIAQAATITDTTDAAYSLKAVAEWLKTTLARKDFHVNIKVDKVFNEDGNRTKGQTTVKFDTGQAQVYLDPQIMYNDRDVTLTVIHELTHALTIDAIDRGEKGTGTEAEKRAYRNLKKLYDAFKAEYQTNRKTGEDIYEELRKGNEGSQAFLNKVYPGKNIREFVVGIMTQKEFRHLLRTLPYSTDDTGKVKTFWDKIKEFFNRIIEAFGVAPDSTTGKALRDIMLLTKTGNIRSDNGDMVRIPLASVPAPVKKSKVIGEAPDTDNLTDEDVEGLEDEELTEEQVEAEMKKQAAPKETQVKQGLHTVVIDPETGAPVQVFKGKLNFTKGAPIEISSNSKGLGAALTNPTELSKSKGNITQSYPITYNGIKYPDVEAAYQALKHKATVDNGPRSTYVLMVELLKAKLQQYPKLVTAIALQGGAPWILKSTHQPTTQNSVWETGGQNWFIKALEQAYSAVSITEGKNSAETTEHMAYEPPTPEDLEGEEIYDEDDFDAPSEVELQMMSNTGPVPRRQVTTTKAMRLIAERQASINQLYKKRKSVVSRLQRDTENLTVEERTELKQKDFEIKARIDAIQDEIIRIRELSKLEDIVEVGTKDLAFIEKKLTEWEELVNKRLHGGTVNNDELDFQELNILSSKIDLWKNYADNFLTNAEKVNLNVVNLFNPLMAPYATAESRLIEIKKKEIFRWAETVIGRKLDEVEFWGLQKDIGTLGSMTLSADNANHPIIQTAFEFIKRTESHSREELLAITEEVKTKTEAVKGKEHVTGKNFSNFFETDEKGNRTGNLVTAYSPTYLKEKDNLISIAKQARTSGNEEAYILAQSALNEFIKENEIAFDIRKLVKLEGHEDMFEKDNGALETLLKQTVGEAEYERLLENAHTKYENYLADLNIVENTAESSFVDEADKEEYISVWKVNNNMFAHLDYRQDPDKNLQAAFAWKYITSVPKATKADGTATGFYNDKYLKLQQDPAVADLHRYILKLLGKLRGYMPNSKKAEFKFNSLPALQKALWDTFTTKGVAAGMVSFMDTAKMSLVSADVSELLFGAEDDSRNLKLKIQTLSSRIESIYSQKVNDLRRSSPFITPVSNPEVFDKLKAEAVQEAQDDSNVDLLGMLGAYTAALVSFNHKSKIEDVVRIAEQMFISEVKEPQTNAQGVPQTRIFDKDNRVAEILKKSMRNQQDMFKYYLDRFWQMPKTVEGKTKKLLYTNKEGKRKKELEAELKEYKTEIAVLEAQRDALHEKDPENPEDLAKSIVDKSAKDEEIAALRAKIIEVENELGKLGKPLTGSGIAKGVMQYITIKGLGWNIFGGFTNLGAGWMGNMIEAAGGRWFNESQIVQGYRLALASVGKSASMGAIATPGAKKIAKLMDDFDILKSATTEMFKDNASKWSKAAETVHWAQVYKRTEYMNQAPVLIAMMLNTKVKALDGSVSNLWVAYGKNGKWDEKSFGPQEQAFDIEARARFKSSVDKAIRNIHGNYDTTAEVALKGTVLGRMLSVFRSWMFEGAKNRFESESVDEIDNFKRKGRYRSYGGGSAILAGAGMGTILFPGLGTALGAGIGLGLGVMFKNTSRFNESGQNMSMLEELSWNTKYLVRKLSMGLAFRGVTLEEKFTKTDAINLRKNMAELSILLYLSGLMMLIKGLKDDEDDEDKKRALTYSLNVMHRLVQDIGFYSEPQSFVQILKDPLPITGLVTDSFLFVEHAMGYILDPESDEIPSGRYAGQSKMKRSGKKLVPGVRIITTTENLMEQEF